MQREIVHCFSSPFEMSFWKVRVVNAATFQVVNIGTWVVKVGVVNIFKNNISYQREQKPMNPKPMNLGL